MIIAPVVVSGTVGVAVRAAGKQAILEGLFLTPSGANATIKVREGVTSTGVTVFFGRAPSAQGTKDFSLALKGMRFDRGLHVTVIGTAAIAYVQLN